MGQRHRRNINLTGHPARADGETKMTKLEHIAAPEPQACQGNRMPAIAINIRWVPRHLVLSNDPS